MGQARWLPVFLVLCVMTLCTATFLVPVDDEAKQKTPADLEITHRGDIPEVPKWDDGKDDGDDKSFLTLEWDTDGDNYDDNNEDYGDYNNEGDNEGDNEDDDGDIDDDHNDDEDNEGDHDELYEEMFEEKQEYDGDEDTTDSDKWDHNMRYNKARDRQDRHEYRQHRHWFDRFRKDRSHTPQLRRIFDFALNQDIDTDPFFHMNFGIDIDYNEDREWWKGPKVCKRIEETGDADEGTDHAYRSSITRHSMVTTTVCDDTGTVYKCTTNVNFLNRKKTMSTIYECCHGYQRQEKKAGCTKKIQMKNLLETLESLGATDMIEALEGVSLAQFIGEGNYTIFAPIESLLEDIKPVQETNIVVVSPDLIKMAKDLEETISTHIVEGFVKTTHVEDEQLLPTLSSGDTIRINIYETPKRLVTANCQPLLSTDNMAVNGVVHVIKSPMAPVKHSIGRIINKHPDLKILKKVVERTGVLPLLKRDGQYTFLAPSDTAFSELDPYIKDKLLAGGHCIEDVVRNHLLPNVICSSILEGNLFAINLLNNYLNVTRDDELFVEDALVVQADLMATNGVIHIIDKVLIPKEVLTLPELASELGADTMLDMIGHAKMSDDFTQLENFTAFIPSDAAFKKLSESQLISLKEDATKLKQILNYHILNSTERFDDLDGGSTYSTAEPDKHIHIQAYNKFPFISKTQKMVQCAQIEKADVGCCGGVVHIIDKVLVPPSGDIISTLEADDNFSKLVEMLKQTRLPERLHNQEILTLFAPTNQALDAMSSEAKDYLNRNPEKLEAFIANHIAKDSICCSGVFDGIFMSCTKPTLDGSVILPQRNGNKVSINKVPIVECDIMATNGIIHSINDVIPEAVNRHIRPYLHQQKNKGWFHGHIGDVTDKLEAYMDQLLNHLTHKDSNHDNIKGLDNSHEMMDRLFKQDWTDFNSLQVPSRHNLPHRKPTHIHRGKIDHGKDEPQTQGIIGLERDGLYIPKSVTGLQNENIKTLSGRRHHWRRPHAGPHAGHAGRKAGRRRGQRRPGSSSSG